MMTLLVMLWVALFTATVLLDIEMGIVDDRWDFPLTARCFGVSFYLVIMYAGFTTTFGIGW